MDNECFALLCSVLPTSKAKRSGLRQFLRGDPRFALLCLANLEGQAKWAKAIFEGVPRLRHPGLGTLATSNPGRKGLGTRGLGTLTTSNPVRKRLGTLAYAPWRRAIPAARA